MTQTPLKPTPGPWQWVVNPNGKNTRLMGNRKVVMDLRRWGLHGAQALFRDDKNVLQDMMQIYTNFPGREHHVDWEGTLDHPDARLIAAAPLLLEALTSMLQQQAHFETCASCRDGDFCDAARLVAPESQRLVFTAYEAATGHAFAARENAATEGSLS